jgi:hypothetical protein
VPDRRAVVALLVVVLLAVVGLPTPGHAAPPVLPIALDGRFLTGLQMPTLAPGTSGGLEFLVGDPLGARMTDVVLSFSVYAFNAYPGNATGPVLAGSAPTFSGAGTSNGSTVMVPLGTLQPQAPPFACPGNVSMLVSAPSGAAQGTYAVRSSLTFLTNGTNYVLESRGYFSAAQWESATGAPGAESSLNLSRLGVSGVIPDSAVLVRSNPFPLALAIVLGGALVLAAVGGYWAVRRRPGSTSGARAGPPPNQAETALGKSRTSDGD